MRDGTAVRLAGAITLPVVSIAAFIAVGSVCFSILVLATTAAAALSAQGLGLPDLLAVWFTSLVGAPLLAFGALAAHVAAVALLVGVRLLAACRIERPWALTGRAIALALLPASILLITGAASILRSTGPDDLPDTATAAITGTVLVSTLGALGAVVWPIAIRSRSAHLDRLRPN